VSPPNLSHQDPVYQVAWVQSRSGTEFASVSTDGQVLWWDSRKLDKGPLDNMVLSLPNTEAELTYGATGLNYRADAGATRYLVATEQGQVLLCDRKAKKDKGSDKTVKQVYGDRGGGHTGPITAVQRNPHPNMLKYFLTVGDWTARVWNEDCKTPVLVTPYDSGYVLDAAWSPSRTGLFYVAKSSGAVEAWDLALRHDRPALSVRVSDYAVCSVQPQWVQPLNATHQKHAEVSCGLLAVGDVKGTVTLFKTNVALNRCTKDEKRDMVEAMEREAKREKACEVRMLAKRREKKENERSDTKDTVNLADTFQEDDENVLEMLRKAEAEFYQKLETQKLGEENEDEDDV
jgi:dynein intermediate chain 2